MSEERFKKLLAVLIAVVTVIAAILAQLQAEAGNRDDRANRDSKQASVEAFGLQIRGSTQANYHYFTAFEQYRELETLSEAAEKRHDSKAAERYGSMRDRLLDKDQALTDFISEYPDADAGALRTLIRNARKEKELSKPPKNFRALYQAIKAVMDTQNSGADQAADTDSDTDEE